MVQRDAMVATVALALGATALFESAQLPFGTIHNPGQGFFPWWISAVIVLLAVALLVQARAPSSTASRESPARVVQIAALLVVLAAYTFLLDRLGYPLCTFLLVLFMLRVTDPQQWTIALSMAALTAVGSYVIFAVWLSVPLPRGPF